MKRIALFLSTFSLAPLMAMQTPEQDGPEEIKFVITKLTPEEQASWAAELKRRQEGQCFVCPACKVDFYEPRSFIDAHLDKHNLSAEEKAKFFASYVVIKMM